MYYACTILTSFFQFGCSQGPTTSQNGMCWHPLSASWDSINRFVMSLFNKIEMHMGVNPKIGGKNPKWMVKIMENPIKMDDLGGNTPILGNTYMSIHVLYDDEHPFFADICSYSWCGWLLKDMHFWFSGGQLATLLKLNGWVTSWRGDLFFSIQCFSITIL